MVGRILPPMIGITLAVSALRLAGEKAGLFPTEVGVAFMAAVTVALLWILTVRAGRAVEQVTRERDARQRLHEAVLASVFDGVAITDAQGRIVYLNTAAETILRRSKTVQLPFERALRGERIQHEPVIVGRAGSATQLTVNASPIFDEDGRPAGAVASFRDVTAMTSSLRQIESSLREKEALIKEVHHRVKNNLQVVSSLLSLQARQVSDPVALEGFRASRDRVRAMALLHEQLYQNAELGDVELGLYLRQLADMLKRGAADPTLVDITVESDGLVPGFDLAVPCGLIVNELATNAMKHAFGGGRGRIRVDVQVTTAGFLLVVADDGVGLRPGLAADLESSSGLGLKLVQSLVKQLEGTLAIDSTPRKGTRFVVAFPFPFAKEQAA